MTMNVYLKVLCSVVAALLLATGPVPAQDQPKVDVKPLVSGLDNPCGVAVHRTTGEVFVSDSAAGRVLRINPQSGGEATPVITGFAQDIYGKGPMYNIGPLGLLIGGNGNFLVVGGGSHKDGEELMKIFRIPEAGKTLTPNDAVYTSEPIRPGEASQLGEGNFYALAANEQGIYITSNGDDTKGWVLRIPLANGKMPGALEPFIATKVATEVDAPVGMTTDRDGNLVIGQMGEVNIPTDSLLTLYDVKSGKLLWKAPTGLYDIAGLAYSPKSGKLYAVDFGWMDAKQGGLFRLDVASTPTGATVKATKIAALDKPSAMAFGQDNALYVTVFGSAPEGSGKKAGQLLRITGDL
jgi:hypothetical protein